MTMEGDEAEETNANIRRKLRFLFLWMVLGIVICNTTVAALQTVQTSINIEDSKGAIALSSGYIFSVFFGLFCSPMLLKLVGANGTLAICDISILLYCLSNLSQELSILVVGAVVGGVGRAAFVPAYTLLVLEVAASTARYSDKKNERYYRDYYQSRFYAMLESIAITGNLIAYATLYGYTASDNTQESQPTRETPLDNSTFGYSNPYKFCGVNDCQDPGVVEENLDQYQPPDRTSVYVLVAVTVALNVIALLTHVFVYPGLGRYSQKLAAINDNGNGKLTSVKEVGNRDGGVQNSGYVDHENSEKSPGERKDSDDGTQSHLSTASEQDIKREHDGSTLGADLWNTLKDTGKFLMKPRALMLSVSTLHYGMMLGFVVADVTRAYASCIVGVELTGLFTVMFGLLAMPSALLYGKFHFRNKRYIMYGACCTLEIGMYCLCFFWIPNDEDQWVILVIFGGFGIVNGVFRQNIIAAYTLHFVDNRAVAFSIFQVFYSIGIGIQYALTTVMCVKDKIYTQIGIVVAGAILFAWAEFIRHRKLAKDTSDKVQETTTRL